MTLLSRKISLSQILSCFLVIYMFASLAYYLIFRNTKLYNFTTLSYSLLLCGILLACLWFFKEEEFPNVAMMTLFFIVFMLPRLLEYLTFPSMVILPNGLTLNVNEINHSLGYIILGTISAFIGFYISRVLGSMISLDIVPAKEFRPSAKLLWFLFLMIALLNIYIVVILGDGLWDILLGAKHKIIGVLSVIVNLSVAFLVVLVALYRRQIKIRKLIVSFAFIFFIVTTICGSRGAAETFLISSLAAMLAIFNNFKVKVVNIASFLLLITFLSLPSFYLGTLVRTKVIETRNHILETRNQKNGGYFRALIHHKVQSHPNNPSLAGSILDRLGVLDFAIIIISRKGDLELKKKFMTFTYSIKSAINIIIPGTVFSDAKINTSFLPPFIYERVPLYHLYEKGYYESRYWTAWGISGVMFGPVGGLIVLSLTCFILQFSYRFLQSCSWPIRHYFGAWFLLDCSFPFWGNMGLDDLLAGMEKTFLSLCTLLLFIVLATHKAIRRVDSPI